MDGVRQRLAAFVGCEPAELALTRNTTESLHAAQCGLDLRPGDEVVTTHQDYTRMLWAWDQRARRDGIVVRRIQFQVPTTGDDLLRRFEAALTPRTRVVHFCHLTGTTGQLFPVREICGLARARGIVSIVDGGHAVGHIPVDLRALDCDVYASSLHKWLLAPHGTGLLFVRRSRIADLWPLFPAIGSMRGDIRKFEEVGTKPAAAQVAIGDALDFQLRLGTERKAERLAALTQRWIEALRNEPRVRILSDPDQSWALATFALEGVRAPALVQHLLDRHRIVVSAVTTQGLPGPVLEYEGVRVTPNVYTSFEEVDRFVAAVRDVIRRGIA